MKAIYLTGSFLIVRMKVRYSPNHYLLLIIVFAISPTGVITVVEPLDREIVSW